MTLNRPYNPYGNSGEIIENPFPGPMEDHSGGAVEQQIEMSRRALTYRSRFETPAPDTGDVSRGSGEK